jgi:glycosyltransferase involved in cell wall biosynthesis
MHEKKGQDILLEALSRVKHQYGYTNFHIDFVGAGPSRSYLEELSARLGLSGEVTFAGEQNRDWLYEQLASYHLMVQPSRYEGFGLTILEGFAAGLPVLASDIEGPAEIIRRTPRGFVFANEDVQQCGEMLHQIFQQYESGSMEALMKQTMPITDHEYSIEACVSGYLKEYEQLIQ